MKRGRARTMSKLLEMERLFCVYRWVKKALLAQSCFRQQESAWP